MGICFVYLQRNPAEKISILGSYKTISQNIEVFFSNIFSDNGALLKQKYDLESYYETLISLAEDKGCIPDAIVTDLQDTYEKLLVESKKDLKFTLEKYIEKEMDFDYLLKQDCTTTKEELQAIDNAEPFNEEHFE
ncbi:MAG: hypothetical protein K6E76_05325 [Patescibacteria group bacterium]|nr:hypothetical protein [Patescibacteria group bacterium]